MTKPIKYTMTNESITFVYEGVSNTVKAGATNYLGLRKALLAEDWDEAIKHMTIKKSIGNWGERLKKLTKGKFEVRDGEAYFNGSKLPAGMSERINKMAAKGEDPIIIFQFWERLKKNPSFRSVNQLWSFLEHGNIPIVKGGFFLAYKGVTENLKDMHSRTFDNSPGVTNEMPRNEISDDPNIPCHEGFHVGALPYASQFGKRMVICKIDPEHVVCVPYDSSSEKVRVCKYEVIGLYGSPLPDTVTDDDGTETLDEGTPTEKKETATKKGGVAVTTKKTPSASWQKYHRMGMKELMELSLDDLRQYAGKGVHLVGASKIPGGKTALVTAILKARR